MCICMFLKILDFCTTFETLIGMRCVGSSVVGFVVCECFWVFVLFCVLLIFIFNVGIFFLIVFKRL